MEYLFILGRASNLCLAELETVLTRNKISFQTIFKSSKIFHVLTPSAIDHESLIHNLGGTIKICQAWEKVKKTDEDRISEKVGKRLAENNAVGRIVFGLSSYGSFSLNDLTRLSKEVKKRLEETGLKARFILPKDEQVLSSVVISKQKVSEIILAEEGNELVLSKTLVVQDFEDWGKRDFGRPAPDPKQGMLPPKVARMMVNIGMAKGTILDPFCGTGTILAEGLMLGCQVIGGDQNQDAIERTKKNLEWLKQNFQFSISPSASGRTDRCIPSLRAGNFQLVQSDATHISEKLPPESIDAIVTEPYLGPMLTNENIFFKKEKWENIILGLEKLYLGCLKDWYKILKPEGRIMIAMPSFKIGKEEFFVKKPLDSCENLGYTLLAGPYQYSRPQAVVLRNIYLLQKRYLS